MTAFEELGGEPALRAIIEDFVDQCFDDVMIGFMFQRANRDRIKRFEYEHAAAHLGAGIEYGGREIGQAHARHRIMGGQFMRRLQILKDVLAKHEVSDAIRGEWIARHEALRGAVTGDKGSECR